MVVDLQLPSHPRYSRARRAGAPWTIGVFWVLYRQCCQCLYDPQCDVALLVPHTCERHAGDDLPTALALAIHPSQPIHRDDIPSRRAGNDRVVGPGLDREVRAGAVQPGRGRALASV